MDNNIKIGDVLFLEEHNCNITVEAITTENMIVCVWQDKNYYLHRSLINPKDLSTVKR